MQRQFTQNFMLEAAFVGNRGAYLMANNLDDLNALTPQILAAHGLSLSNSANLSLLSSTFTSGKPTSRGFQRSVRYLADATTAGAGALRPFPQFGSINAQAVPKGDSWYDALQVKATLRPWHGLYSSMPHLAERTHHGRKRQGNDNI